MEPITVTLLDSKTILGVKAHHRVKGLWFAVPGL